ncbi:hypothetical protein PZ895_01650 [Mesorhizobium sp. YIM 152430]|uniref:hypothetical protein n=1 Tax=Mesorhizobium sp. YIM 152430 TaxID=3031761 RepID=UPI0023DB716B|nr:hypothetical protein [Mesorhizobium sp. YIM 152430]MDF1598476.1 hypothetical protein [Mesorhizobium sp. YIM 152430]
MFKFAKTAALSALIGLGALAAAPAQANATSLQFHGNAGTVTVQWGGGYRGDRWHRGGHRHHRQACTPGQAVHKAARMGLRNPRVVNANRNVIRVAGRAWRYGRTAIVFARAPNCPVIR